MIPRRSKIRTITALACLATLQLGTAPSFAEEPAAPNRIFIQIIDGEGALNDIRSRTAREPIVEVDDENHKPIAGALVLFSTPRLGTRRGFPQRAHQPQSHHRSRWPRRRHRAQAEQQLRRLPDPGQRHLWNPLHRRRDQPDQRRQVLVPAVPRRPRPSRQGHRHRCRSSRSRDPDRDSSAARPARRHRNGRSAHRGCTVIDIVARASCLLTGPGRNGVLPLRGDTHGLICNAWG